MRTENGDHHAPEPAHDEQFWNERYETSARIWSGNPNPQLVAEVEGLEPGRALDVGCGEGADAIWLAQRGWQVVATDISGVALGRAAVHARETDAAAAARIEWRHVDLLADGDADPTRARLLRPRLGAVHAAGARAAWTALHHARRCRSGPGERSWSSATTHRTWPPACTDPRSLSASTRRTTSPACSTTRGRSSSMRLDRVQSPRPTAPRPPSMTPCCSPCGSERLGRTARTPAGRHVR